MDRVNGHDWFDIGDGKRGFRAQNAGAGIPGTEVTAAWLNGVQEELAKVIEEAGLDLNTADNTQLWQALWWLSAARFARFGAWLPVISMTTTEPPAVPAVADTYLVPTAATGDWAGKDGKIADWTGTAWGFFTPKNGHGVGLPDGRLFVRIAGVYVEFLATADRAGLVRLATAAEVEAGTPGVAVTAEAMKGRRLQGFITERTTVQSLAHGVLVKLLFSGSDLLYSFLGENTFVNSVFKVGAGEDGLYDVRAACRTSAANYVFVAVYIYKNGVDVGGAADVSGSAAGNGRSVNFSKHMKLTAGDEIELRAMQLGPGVAVDATNTAFSVARLAGVEEEV